MGKREFRATDNASRATDVSAVITNLKWRVRAEWRKPGVRHATSGTETWRARALPADDWPRAERLSVSLSIIKPPGAARGTRRSWARK